MQGGQAVTTVAPGSSVEVFGSGFAPGAAVAIDIASTPTLLTTATADANYDVWFSTNLANWILLGPAEKFSTGLFQFVDASATNSPYRFYRASAP